MADPLSKSDLVAALALFAGDPTYFQLDHGTFGQTVPCKPKTGVDPCEVWCSLPVEKLREICNVIKIRIFWCALFTRESTSFVDTFCLMFLDWDMKKVHEFNVMEDLADLIKKVVNIPHFISGILRIGTGIENGLFPLGEALDWVRSAGDPGMLQGLERMGDFGRVILAMFFSEWKRYITKVALEDFDLVADLQALTCESSRKKSEAMKQRGNAEFAQGALGSAIVSYTKAIEFCPTNHLLYGNRALCFILTRQYGRAVLDGKRAIVLKPDWPKGHHHYCKALALLGKAELALAANARAQELCQGSPEGLRELLTQSQRLRGSGQGSQGTEQRQQARKDLPEKKDRNSSKSPPGNSREQKGAARERKRSRDEPEGAEMQEREKVTEPQRAEGKGSTLEQPPNQSQQSKRKPKSKTSDHEKMRDHVDLKREKAMEDKGFCAVPQGDFSAEGKSLGLEGDGASLARDKPIILPLMRALNTPEFTVDFSRLPEAVKALARDGCRALQEQQCHSAELAFSRLLGILCASGVAYMNNVNILNINYVIFLYGHATALLGMGHPEALAKAEVQFKKIIEQYPEESCFCLAHYGIGRVYLRQNRFVHALDQFLRSKLMIDFNIVPGVLTWPGTTQVIEETRIENLQMALRNYIEECKFPPAPDAVCRYQQCHGYSKIQIYFTDPDFKGFIRVICCQQCRVEFHISCWKKLKTASYSDKNDKDFLKEICFTPDCKGLISKIVIFSPPGVVKCEFEQKIPKLKEPPRACIKQKCTSLRNIKIKQEKKKWRKRAREAARNAARNSVRNSAEEKQEGKEQPQGSQHRGAGQDLYAGDQILQHLRRNAEKIKAAVPDPAGLLRELLAWGVMAEQDFSSYSQIHDSQEVLERLLSSLIQERSRVQSRSFLHVLSRLPGVEGKVHKWLQHLDQRGLTATKNFLHQYGQVLQELDFSILTPLWNQRYGSKFDKVAADGEKKEICDYFLAPPLEKSRCFIWLLEENREHFPQLHQALDEFFDKMDDPTIILKKQGNENLSNNEIKVKNKNRKKNLKDSKSILVLSSGISTAPREEEKIFIEENNMYRDFPNENPFGVPEHLQDQLEEFEARYNIANSNNYQINNNNNPDPISENLYDYFSQILEEHGPLEINNKLLIGEYENFPEETRKVVEDGGGLEAFLLKSLRFLMVDNLIGLQKHSALFEGDPSRNENKDKNPTPGECQGNPAHSKLPLNPYAQEFKPLSYPVEAPVAAAPDLSDYHTPQYFPCSFPAPCAPGNPLEDENIDSMESQAPFSGVLLEGFQPAGPAVFLPQSSWGYQYGILPLAQAGLIYADPAAPGEHLHSAIPSPELFVPAEIQQCKGPWGQLENSDKKDSALSNGSGEAEGDKCVKKEKGKKNKGRVKSNPHTRMVAVQVNQEVADRETNTLPFHPFENQQGDILRLQKEHRVLQEQLRQAQLKSEQSQSRSREEISALQGLLRKSIEESEVSQNELDWFHQDSEAQMRKWQQEKKENRENLKALKGTAKKHSDTNERYLKSIEEKEKQYNASVKTFLKASKKFANEKSKLEELIKKSQNERQQCEKRAVEAEVSVLQSWKEAESWRLRGAIAKAQGNLRVLRALGSSASAAPVLKSQIDSWEIFISNVKKQLEKVEAEYEEKLEQVGKGARGCLSRVEVVDLPWPQGFVAMPLRAAVCDPAIVTCSAPAHPSALPAFPSSDGKAPAQPSLQAPSGATAAPEAPPAPGKAPDKHPRAPERSHPAKIPPGASGRNSQPAQPSQDPSALQQRPPAMPTNKKLPKKKENILAQLQSVFPNCSSSELTAAIREVQRRNGSSLSPSEILSRATELILDQQFKAPAAGTALPSPGPAAPARAREAPTDGPSPGSAPKTSAGKNPSQPNLQPWGSAGAIPKAKWRKQDSAACSEDPCSICHDELSSDCCELECGHHFHRECIRTWLKQHSSCPICRVHALLPEDFPELPAWNRPG
ncbi:E3 ubiquitin-protein ligase TTC3 isoform X2 [Zonotrichia albicollis]|uniref:E3 ubiquitin-protein ligase TTC3 isoform X2 n=1 Tax=Zonotrichia albicollis TaxID=44394 RepID=UPI003D8122B0